MNSSAAIQESVYKWALEQNFTAPYGVLTGEHQSKKGRKYKSVTFGYSRTLDATVEVFNRSFIVYKSSLGENHLFKSYEEMMKFLTERFNTVDTEPFYEDVFPEGN